MTKYVNNNGVSEMWLNIKNWVTSQLLGYSQTGHTHSASDITSGLSTVATSGSYNDLSNKPTIPTVNNATLIIQKNGSTVGTFSANQATDETIDITVPDVNNGTLTIQQNGTAVDTFTANSSSDKTVNIQCVDLTNNQTVGGIKTFSNAPVVGSIDLDGKSIDTDANGNMTYDSHIVDTIEEQGAEYIRYSNGLQICWGRVSEGRQTTKTFPKSFSTNPSVSVTVNSTDTGSIATINCTAQAVAVYNNVEYYSSYYLAIGRWK